jgi:hypothetical protein
VAQYEWPAWLVKRLDSSTAADQVENQDDDCNHQQDVDEASADVQTETKQPENEEDNDDCPKHEGVLLTVCPAIASAEGCAS